mmetsp:Transcript_59688/g.119816  ORF Transcript_59688/g.119816 Transcript_59688/m.119816 type:complete len:361 (-) Transcript_59688:160-1242(-)
MDSSFIPGADSDEGDTYKDPKEKIAFMVKNLEGLEMQASEGAEPAVVPLEGKSFHDQLLALKESVARKKFEIEGLKLSNEQHSMVAQEIDDKMSVIEGAHAKDLMKLGESQKEETAKMERVLGSMKETKAEVEGQLRKKKEAVAALELSILDLQAGVTDLSKRVQSAEAEAEAEIDASDAEITTKKSQAVSKTTTLQTQAETDNAEASQAQADLRDLGDKLSGARSRKNESLNRVEASEKNLEKKRQAKANTEAQLKLLEAQAESFRVVREENLANAGRARKAAVELRERALALEGGVEAAITAQEKAEAALGATAQHTARLEGKVRGMEVEKEGLALKINNYSDASRAFCFSFDAADLG